MVGEKIGASFPDRKCTESETAARVAFLVTVNLEPEKQPACAFMAIIATPLTHTVLHPLQRKQ